MIRSVRIRRFKRFRDAEFHLPCHAVLTGSNDTGKTTLLQAIASWALALRRWRELGDLGRRNGYRRAPIARQAFVTVPLRGFDLLWHDRHYHGAIEVELCHDAGWSVTMEFIRDTTEQIYVRPRHDALADTLREIDLDAVFIPPMTGVGLSEPLLMPPKIEQSLGLGRPGGVLRNLLADTVWNESAWDALQATIGKLFGYRLLRPHTDTADILADYEKLGKEVPLDITGAGSGFQQVLLLLALLYTRPGAVLLLDKPDTHLHPTMQVATYRELRNAAHRCGSQLIATTDSEALINATDPHERVGLE